MLTRARLMVTSIVSLATACSCIVLIIVLKPILLNHAQKVISQAIKTSQAEIAYTELEPSWNGFRLKNLNFKSDGIELAGEATVHLNFWPGRNFAYPKKIILEKSSLMITRHDKNSSLVKDSSPKLRHPAKAQSHARKQNFLRSLMQREIDIEIRNLKLKLSNVRMEPIFSLERVNVNFSSIERVVDLKIGEIFYRDQVIFSSLDAQLILAPQNHKLPFIVTAIEQGSGPWQIQGTIADDLNSIEMRHKRLGLPTSWRKYLASIEPKDSLELLIKMRVQGLTNLDDLNFDLQLASNNLKLNHPVLSSQEVGPWPITVRARGLFSLERGSITVKEGAVHILKSNPETHIKSFFSLTKQDLLASITKDPWTILWHLPKTSCQSFLEILPDGAFPVLEGFKLAGDVQLFARAELLNPKGRAIEFPPEQQNFDCRLAKVPAIFTKEWIKGKNSTPAPSEMKDNPAYQALRANSFLPKEAIADDFLRALVAAEDASFWLHSGVRTKAITAAMEANLKAGKILFGGSTITMQMVKNLYLNHERVLSRKLQELFLSWAIEQEVDKTDIIEIYANIVEFGPGIFGVGAASQAYFGKTAADLSTAEAVFLASILPSPRRHYSESFCSGRLSPKIQERMLKVATGLASMQTDPSILRAFQASLPRLHFPGQGSCPKLDEVSHRKNLEPIEEF